MKFILFTILAILAITQSYADPKSPPNCKSSVINILQNLFMVKDEVSELEKMKVLFSKENGGQKLAFTTYLRGFPELLTLKRKISLGMEQGRFLFKCQELLNDRLKYVVDIFDQQRTFPADREKALVQFDELLSKAKQMIDEVDGYLETFKDPNSSCELENEESDRQKNYRKSLADIYQSLSDFMKKFDDLEKYNFKEEMYPDHLYLVLYNIKQPVESCYREALTYNRTLVIGKS